MDVQGIDVVLVKEKVRKISNIDLGNERAHIAEDELWEHVLSAIATGLYEKEDAAVLAREALRTRDLDFTRWYA